MLLSNERSNSPIQFEREVMTGSENDEPATHHDDDNDDNDDDGFDDNSGLGFIEHVIQGDTRMDEGVLVEIEMNVSLSGGEAEEHGESVTRTERIVQVLSQPESSQVATQSMGEHMFPSHIETDVVDLATHCTTLPSHSSISQQIVVSDIHGD